MSNIFLHIYTYKYEYIRNIRANNYGYIWAMFQLRLVNFFGNTRDHIELINEEEPFLQIIWQIEAILS